MSFESSFVLPSFLRGIGKAERGVFFSTASKSEADRRESEESGAALAGVRNSRMASDEDYAAFLDKANQDPGEGAVKTQGKRKVELKAVDQGVRVPAGLKKATSDAFYVSDSDEPFEPVCLKFDGKKLPDEGEFFVGSLMLNIC